MLEKLFTSKIRVRMLQLLFSEGRMYLREIAKKTGANINSVRREAKNLESLGILLSERSGNMVFYAIDKKGAIFDELHSIFLKTYGAIPALRALLAGREGVAFAFVYGSYAKGSERIDSDIDLIIVGDIGEDLLLQKVGGLEKEFHRQINYMRCTRKEFDQKKKEPFLSNVLKGKKIMVAGDISGTGRA